MGAREGLGGGRPGGTDSAQVTDEGPSDGGALDAKGLGARNWDRAAARRGGRGTDSAAQVPTDGGDSVGQRGTGSERPSRSG